MKARFQPACVRLCFALSFVAVVAAAACGGAHAATIRIDPTVARTGNDSNLDGTWDTFYDSFTVGSLLAHNGPPHYNYRAAMEFSLDRIPRGSTITGATLLVSYAGASGGRTNTLQFHAYPGDGRIDLRDFEVSNPIGPRFNAFGAPGVPDFVYRVPATPFIRSLVNTGQPFAGFMAENVTWNQTDLASPALSVTYTPVPEPAAFAGVVAAAAMTLLSRRGRARRR